MREQEVSTSTISNHGIRRLLSFLPVFDHCDEAGYGDGPTVALSENGKASIVPTALCAKASEFVTACYEENFVQPFDWGKWADRHTSDLTSHAFIAGADLGGIIKMLTAHIRGDRFCDGHLLSVMRDGTILKILQRLREIHSARDP